jgi:hypothetical protein
MWGVVIVGTNVCVGHMQVLLRAYRYITSSVPVVTRVFLVRCRQYNIVRMKSPEVESFQRKFK